MKVLIVLAAVLEVLSAEADYSPCNDPLQWHFETAVREINDRHHHGYKHRLSKVVSHQLIEKERLECELNLELELEETKCHILNPKPLTECEFRKMEETKVKSNCKVTLRLAARKVEVLKSFSCNSEPASEEELIAICPYCPTLLNLTDDQGLDSIKQALKKFNQESNDPVIFTVMQVGRLSTQSTLGQTYFAEFAIVETNCSKGKESEDCSPLCDSKARRGFCSSTVLGNGNVTVDCEIYAAKEEILVKPRTYYMPFLHSFHSHPCGPEAVQPDLPFLPGLMPLIPSLGQDSSLPHKFPHCPGQLKIAPTIHSICPPPSGGHP